MNYEEPKYTEVSIKGTCPKCGKTEHLVLREFDDNTAFQYCSECQWSEQL